MVVQTSTSLRKAQMLEPVEKATAAIGSSGIVAGSLQPLSVTAIEAEILKALNRTPLRPGLPSNPDRPKIETSPSHRDPSRAPLSLDALVALEGEDFIEAAYETILDRSADPTGRHSLLDALLHGQSKVETLSLLQQSEEGREIGRPIAGLNARLLAENQFRSGLLRRLLRLFRNMLRSTATVQRLHRLETAQKHSRRWMEEQLRQAREENSLLRQLREEHDQLQRSVGDLVRKDRERERSTEDRYRQFEDKLGASTREQGALAEKLRRLVEALDPASLRKLEEQQNIFAEQLARLGSVHALAASAARRSLDQERRLGLLLSAVRGEPQSIEAASSQATVKPAIVEATEHLQDEFDFMLATRLRGKRNELQRRLKIYIPLLADWDAGRPERPFLDLAAGAGEWLELLGEAGFVATGLEQNGVMESICRDRGLTCLMIEPLVYLKSLPDDSLGAVTAFHLFERTPFPQIIALIDESLRVLKPGGVLLVEMMNPANLTVLAHDFYLDPRHLRPIPSELMGALVEERGYVTSGIIELNAEPRQFEARDKILAAEMDRLFHGPRDYALIARKP